MIDRQNSLVVDVTSEGFGLDGGKAFLKNAVSCLCKLRCNKADTPNEKAQLGKTISELGKEATSEK